jgi:integrase
MLWPSPKPRAIRFHDLRHTTATLLLKARVPLAVVQRILGHSSPTVTAGVYGHLDVEDMRAGLEQLSLRIRRIGAVLKGTGESKEAEEGC